MSVFATQIVMALNRMSTAKCHSGTADVDAFASLTNARLSLPKKKCPCRPFFEHDRPQFGITVQA
jgi:hypothetical protein